jgi:hypothetical protein
MSTAAPTLTAEQREAVRALAEHWPGPDSHQRHAAYRALAGGLVRGKLPTPTAEALVEALAEATDDDDGAAKRVQLVGDTVRRSEAGKDFEGWPSLIRQLGADGEALVGRVRDLLGIGGRKIVATYDYVDEAGCFLFQTVRYDPKDFKQRRRDGKGGWVWSLAGVARVLYRLPELLAADTPDTVFIPEGEKDVENLRALGLVATTNPMGANNKWRCEYNEALRGRPVVILPDNDDPGREHALDVARNLAGVAASVKLLELPGLPFGGDVSDWLVAGGTAAELVRLAEAADPWQGETVPAALPPEPPWPDPPDGAAYHGLAGDVVRAIGPHSEADPVALLAQILVAFGNAIGRTAHFRVEGDTHYLNEYVILVGKTGKGRKGTSWGQARLAFEGLLDDWLRDRVTGGASSGEGIIWAVRDPIMARHPVKEKGRVVGYDEVESDPGVTDKRLLLHEPEFASVLKQTERQGNTLSVILRQGWERGDLRSLTKHSPARATGAHVSIVGHITAEEVRRYLTATESANGFGNRFMWLCTKRSKCLPRGGRVPESSWGPLRSRLRDALDSATKVGEMGMDSDAWEGWDAVYPELSEGRPGLAGALLSRAEAHVRRLACLYALLDLSADVRREHLEAALALWEFAEASVRYVFGAALGDPLADELFQALRASRAGLTRTEIRDLFGRHQSGDRIGRALAILLRAGLAHMTRAGTSGRAAERWHAGHATATEATNATEGGTPP